MAVALIVTSILIVKSTLAGGISLSSGSVTFGQGVAQTVSCDDSVLVTPLSTFEQLDGDAEAHFYFTGIKLGDINMETCLDKSFLVKVYNSSTGEFSNLIDHSATPLRVQVIRGPGFAVASGSPLTIEESVLRTTPPIGTVTITFNSPQVYSSKVDRITIENSDATLPSNAAVLNYDFSNPAAISSDHITVQDALGNIAGALTDSNMSTSSGGGSVSIDENSGKILQTTTDAIPILDSFGRPSSSSLFAWIKPTSNGIVVSELGCPPGDCGWHDAQIEIVDGFACFAEWVHISACDSERLTFGQWTLIGFTYDGYTLRAFRNGLFLNSAEGTRTLPWNNGYHLYWAFGKSDATGTLSGSHGAGGAAFDLAIARFYGRALGDVEVASMYNATKSRFGY